MPDQDLTTSGSLPIIAKSGIVDINPITQTRSWFRLNGCFGIAGLLERFNAKRLALNFTPNPILSIHSNQSGNVFIQTQTQLLMIGESDLTSDEVTDDITGQVVIDDITGLHVIA